MSFPRTRESRLLYKLDEYWMPDQVRHDKKTQMIYQEFLTQTLEKASKIANQMFGKTTSRIKDHDPLQVLTEADIKIGKFIIGEIEKQYPDHNIIDEESGVIDKKSEWTWVIDPIDGTANFAVGIPLYGIMIGLLKENTPFAGGISLPFFNKLYLAEKGKEAFVNGEKISTSAGEKLNSKIIWYSLIKAQVGKTITKHSLELIDKILKLYPLAGTTNSVYDSITVAEGRSVGMLHMVSKVWDNVAQHILIEEAGGVYTDFYGKPMDYSKPLERTEQNYTYCAGAPSVHKKLQEIIHSVK